MPPQSRLQRVADKMTDEHAGTRVKIHDGAAAGCRFRAAGKDPKKRGPNSIFIRRRKAKSCLKTSPFGAASLPMQGISVATDRQVQALTSKGPAGNMAMASVSSNLGLAAGEIIPADANSAHAERHGCSASARFRC